MRRLVLATVCVYFLCVPARAHAQWYVAGYLGANHTRAADVHIAQPANGLDLTYANVAFEARPFETPQYYGWRVGRMLGRGHAGIEFEFNHMKMYAITGDTYVVTGQVGDARISGTNGRMSSVVQRYSMSHGLNFLVVNLVSESPIGRSGAAFVIRGGAGPTHPHAETQVNGIEQQQYEWAGLGVHFAAGVRVPVRGPLGVMVEYKVTYAKPKITIADGTGDTTALTQHLAAGLRIGF